jgi:hypothetical protein
MEGGVDWQEILHCLTQSGFQFFNIFSGGETQ